MTDDEIVDEILNGPDDRIRRLLLTDRSKFYIRNAPKPLSEVAAKQGVSVKCAWARINRALQKMGNKKSALREYLGIMPIAQGDMVYKNTRKPEHIDFRISTK